MTIKRLSIAIVGVLALLAIAAFAITWQSELDEVDEHSIAGADQSQIARGYDLAQLGNGQSCHTAEGSEPIYKLHQNDRYRHWRGIRLSSLGSCDT
jgi:mono/diheme cytochrome c family protein